MIMKTLDPYNFCLFKIPTEGGRLIWEITNRCNYSCKYCIFRSGKTDTSDELTTAEIISSLDDMWEFWIRELKITWWEPFMRKDMCEILERAAEIGFKIDISTNASFLTDKHTKTLKNPAIRYVHVSLDGSDRMMQELVRWKYSFDLTLRWLNKLIEAWIYTRIWTVIHKWNEDHLKEMIEHVMALWAQEIIFSLMEPVGRMKWDNSLVTTKDVPTLEKKLSLLRLKYKGRIKVNFAFTKKKEEKSGETTCPGGKKFLFLNHKWQLSPCTWISEYYPEFISKETLKTKSFIELTKWKEMIQYFEFQDNLIWWGMAGCPKSFLKEINQQKELKKLFEGDFNENMKNRQRFSEYSPIYSFATENISGYYPKFDFKDAKALAVTASWDHAINAFYFWASHVTCFDSNSLSRLWTQFKIVAMKHLDFDDFLDFFLREWNNPLSYKTYCWFRSNLPIITKEFFDQAYKSFWFDGKNLRESSLFNNKHDTRENKISYNPYLQSEDDYNLAKGRLEMNKIVFLDDSIEQICSKKDTFWNDLFDLILLSNIADYSHEMYPEKDYLAEFRRNITDVLQESLSAKGKIALAYIYDSGNLNLRNKIDSAKSRADIFGGAWYSEFSFPSAVWPNNEDIVALQEKRIHNSLIESSESYYEKARVYDRFSEAEDSLGKALEFLKEATRDKVVLDVWCWTGKYLKSLAPTIKRGVWLDVSDKQIEIAIEKCILEDNLSFIISSAETIDIPDNSVDVIYWTWCIWSIAEAERRESIVKELKRILKKWWMIYLIENDEIGEFEEIRWKTTNPDKPTIMLNKHIRKMWFARRMSISTRFSFNDVAEAKKVFGTIWWEKVANKINSNEIQHNVMIFCRIR
ncbi:MAG: Heme d1 biosynthesis protein [uncultured bacterium (gcode 4)]|uniref:Heme d1 biosynthesis protein n=1 Tax=uncultured bacterium (gcode 4) TaxID=1234023 RepID=K2G2Q4_9BACT|nr:MAG: Heme d1 biosynthesis protein [uncultured bacterium (gcode 4)]